MVGSRERERAVQEKSSHSAEMGATLLFLESKNEGHIVEIGIQVVIEPIGVVTSQIVLYESGEEIQSTTERWRR